MVIMNDINKKDTSQSIIRTSRGFTLIEVMVVVVILAILAGIIVPRIMGRPEEAKRTKAQIDIKAIEEALNLYKLDNGEYPTTDQGLQALVTKPTSDPIPHNWQPYLKDLPEDPWNRPYMYLSPGEHGEIDIFTYGPTGQVGGSGKNATIGNWDLR